MFNRNNFFSGSGCVTVTPLAFSNIFNSARLILCPPCSSILMTTSFNFEFASFTFRCQFTLLLLSPFCSTYNTFGSLVSGTLSLSCAEAKLGLKQKVITIIRLVSKFNNFLMLITTLLKSLYESLIREMVVMYVETDDINEAFIIFETLNARGKELETSDLLKNHVFRIGGPKINKYKINGIL
ncbi:hypothetical protein CW682_04065 [Macrococcoides caseolyticum]|uniref:Uncharacterized protein n=1 Tax=Macrococcoides caseolyticum TaxID=69966 RepID=A0ACC9MTR0_9STAP|nr:hypothetical protein CW682_04065 [Macrococcus caseolyticus]